MDLICDKAVNITFSLNQQTLFRIYIKTLVLTGQHVSIFAVTAPVNTSYASGMAWLTGQKCSHWNIQSLECIVYCSGSFTSSLNGSVILVWNSKFMLHVRVFVYLCSCVCGFGLVVDLHDSNFKRRRYQIQTWAALLGLTNEELLCERRRNLQHPPFIYTGGLVRTCASVHSHACARACVSRRRGCIVCTVRQNSCFVFQFPSPPPNM